MGKLLIVADKESTGGIAVQRGLHLASKLNCGVDVVAFCYTSMKPLRLSSSQRQEIKKNLIARRADEVQAQIDKLSAAGQKVSLQVVWEKDIVPWIVKRCARPYDALVKTGHRSETFAYTSTDWQLLRECPRPVLIVADKKWQRTKPILASVDLASKVPEKIALNNLVIAVAKRYAAALDAPLVIITAIELPAILTELGVIDPVPYVKEIKAKLKSVVKKLAEAHEVPVSAFRIKKGPVAKVITSVSAQERAQLLVMGTVGRSGVHARLLGNTAESVLQHIRTDVLAVKS
jgi:universal stress protein E